MQTMIYISSQMKFNLRKNIKWTGRTFSTIIEIPKRNFPEVQWSDEEPTKVKLVIEKQYGKGKANTTKCTNANTEIY